MAADAEPVQYFEQRGRFRPDGEPLLRKDLLDILDAATEAGRFGVFNVVIPCS